MSDLTEKFDALEAQLAAQHTVISDDLTAILAALGAPPPGDITTLDDIAAQLTGISNQLTSMASANGTFYTALLDVTGLISTNLETLSNNNSLNSARLLQAIYATACQCPTPTDLLSPPIDVTPTSLVDEAKCRRIQFYLSVFGNWLTEIANYGAAAGFVTGESIYQLLAIVTANAGIVASGAEVGAVAGPPGIVVGAVVGLIILAISTFGGAVLNDYANQFNSPIMQSALLTALFAATNADEGYTAFKSTILANMDAIPAQIIYTLWWTAWSNDIYSGSPVVDDSAFDGSICIPTFSGCADLTSQVVAIEPRSGTKTSTNMILPPEGFTTTNTVTFTGFPPYNFGANVIFTDDMYGYSVTKHTGPTIYFYLIDPSGTTVSLDFVGDESAHTVTTHSTAAMITCGVNEGQAEGVFTITLCEPGA